MKRIILVGKGGSGKDWAKEVLIKAGYRPGISHTTRPIRTGETEGINYYYVEEERFFNLIEQNYFYEWNYFEPGWYYGTSIMDFSKQQVFIMTPSGLAKVKSEDRLESIVVYIDIAEDIRTARLSTRRDADTVERRLKTDQNQFKDYTDWDFCIRDPQFSEDIILNIAKKIK